MPRSKLTPEERREKNRLRSERWRRAHGIGPRRPAQKPWLAEGISRSTWYRRKAKARERAALGQGLLWEADKGRVREVMFNRLAWQVAELRESLDKVAAFNAIMGQVLNEPVPLVW